MSERDLQQGELIADDEAPSHEFGGLEVFVHGLPAPQGSKRGFYNKSTGRVQVVESSKNVKPWREAVKHALLEEVPFRSWSGIPVAVTIGFLLPRPKGHYGTGRNAGQVKPSAPVYPAVKPDLDKLIRSTLDAIKDAGVIKDDAQVVTVEADKRYAVVRVGALISIDAARGYAQ